MSTSRSSFSVVFLATLIFVSGCSLLEHSAPPQPPATDPPRAVPYDLIDGWVVVATEPRYTGDESANPVEWVIEAGDTRIVHDPFSGEFLFRPRGTVPVVARPLLDGVVGPRLEIGIDPDLLPIDEVTFLAAGGGACVSEGKHPAMVALVGDRFEVDVRSVVNATVRPVSKNRRELTYHHAQYHAWSPSAGPMRIRFNPDYVSTTRLTAGGDESEVGNFFPASAETDLHFVIDFLDHGVSVFNKEPMRLRSASTNWPPFRVPQVNSEGDATDFYMVGRPDVLMMTIHSQEQYVYPASELEITAYDLEIGGDRIKTTFEVRNLTNEASQVRWFILGDYGRPETPREGTFRLEPGGHEQVDFSFRPDERLLRQFVTLGAVSEAGPRLTGSNRIEFVYPPETPLRDELLQAEAPSY